MKAVRQYGGQALMAAGALLLVICRVTGWQSNTELLAGLTLVISGYILHVWLQKHGEKY